MSFYSMFFNSIYLNNYLIILIIPSHFPTLNNAYYLQLSDWFKIKPPLSQISQIQDLESNSRWKYFSKYVPLAKDFFTFYLTEINLNFESKYIIKPSLKPCIMVTIPNEYFLHYLA